MDTLPWYLTLQFTMPLPKCPLYAQLQDFDKDTEEFIVDLTMPIDIIFVCIDKLREHAITDGAPYTEAQIVQIAYNLVNKATVFGEYLRTWSQTNPADQTWGNFKIAMRQAQKELGETSDLTIADAGYHQSNMVDEIVTHVQ